MNARLRELLAAATDLPWEVDAYGDVIANGEDVARIATGDDHCMADAALIAEGITALPALLHQLAELKESRDAYRHDAEALLQINKGAVAALEAAERAREEAHAALAAIRDSTFRNAMQLRSIADRFLAASGGKDGR